MTLEETLNRVARALELAGEGSAVAEIIRQRDEAFKQRDRLQRDADYYMKRRDEHFANLEKAKRQVAALRGVITKMRKAK